MKSFFYKTSVEVFLSTMFMSSYAYSVESTEESKIVTSIGITLYNTKNFKENENKNFDEFLKEKTYHLTGGASYFKDLAKKNILPALRVIKANDILGTGFYIDKRFITNAHVLSSIDVDQISEYKINILIKPVSINCPDFAELIIPSQEYQKEKVLNFLKDDKEIPLGKVYIDPFYFYIDLDKEKKSYTFYPVEPLNMIPPPALSHKNKVAKGKSVDIVSTRNIINEPILYKINGGYGRPGISGSPIIKVQLPYDLRGNTDGEYEFSVQSIIYGRHPKAFDILAAVHAPTIIDECFNTKIPLLVIARYERIGMKVPESVKEELLKRFNDFKLGITKYPYNGVEWADLLGKQFRKIYDCENNNEKNIETHQSHIIPQAKIKKLFKESENKDSYLNFLFNETISNEDYLKYKNNSFLDNLYYFLDWNPYYNDAFNKKYNDRYNEFIEKFEEQLLENLYSKKITIKNRSIKNYFNTVTYSGLLENLYSFIIWNPANIAIVPGNGDKYRSMPPGEFLDEEALQKLSGSAASKYRTQAFFLIMSQHFLDQNDLKNFLTCWILLLENWKKDESLGYYTHNFLKLKMNNPAANRGVSIRTAKQPTGLR